TAALLVGIPTPFLTGYLMDRFGRRYVIVPGFASYTVAVILMAMTAFLPGIPFTFFVATYVLVQATQGTTGGTMQVLGTDLSPPFARGRFFAIWRLIGQFGGTITPGIFAFIADNVGYGFGFLYLAVCATVVAIGVGGVLGDTLAKADRADAEAAAARASGSSG